MSSSDYTNLRRLRHVYYPSLNNCHSHVQQTVPHTHPAVNSVYIDPHMHAQPHVHAQPPVYPHPPVYAPP